MTFPTLERIIQGLANEKSIRTGHIMRACEADQRICSWENKLGGITRIGFFPGTRVSDAMQTMYDLHAITGNVYECNFNGTLITVRTCHDV